MAAEPDTSPGALSVNDAQLERLLARSRRQPILDDEELLIARELIDAEKYRRARRKQWKDNWPVIALLVTLAWGAASTLGAYILNHMTWGGSK